MPQRVAVYPASFDPPTHGPLDIVARAARLFDKVVVGVGTNVSKRTLFDAKERMDLMRGACGKFSNVEVRAFDGLTVEFARSCGASFVIRGIRALSDFEFEFEMANMNHQLAPEVERSEERRVGKECRERGGAGEGREEEGGEGRRGGER